MLQKGLLLTSIAFLFYGLGVVAIIGITHWFDFFSIMVGAGFACAAFSAPFFIKLPNILKRTFSFLFIAIFLGFAFTELLIIAEGQTFPKPKAEYVIILGAKVEGFEPSLALNYRINAAAEYMIENCESVALATGGQGVDECISEAEVIKQGLIALGIDPSRILVETQSASTKENFSYGLQIIESVGGSSTSSIVIVSSKYHVFRAKKLAEAIGYERVSTKGCPSMNYLLPHYYAREFVALIKEKWDGNI